MRQYISERTIKVLSLLARGNRTLSQIQKDLDVSKPMALKALSKLEKEGFVRSFIKKTKKGREKEYLLEQFSLVLSYDLKKRGFLAFRSQSPLSLENPLIGQIDQLRFQKATEVYLNAISSAFKKRGIAVILFGSIARGEGTRKSDIDLLFVASSWTKKEKGRINNLLADSVHKASYQAIPHFWKREKLVNDSSNMARSIRDEGIIIFTRGEVNDIWQTLKRYKNISL